MAATIMWGQPCQIGCARMLDELNTRSQTNSCFPSNRLLEASRQPRQRERLGERCSRGRPWPPFSSPLLKNTKFFYHPESNEYTAMLDLFIFFSKAIFKGWQVAKLESNWTTRISQLNRRKKLRTISITAAHTAASSSYEQVEEKLKCRAHGTWYHYQLDSICISKSSFTKLH